MVEDTQLKTSDCPNCIFGICALCEAEQQAKKDAQQVAADCESSGPKPGWLARQIAFAEKDVEAWPQWMKECSTNER